MTVDNDPIGDYSQICAEKLRFFFTNNNKNSEDVSNSFGIQNTEMKSADGLVKKPNGNATSRVCSNCGTSSTSTWRNLGEQIVCNACKCFYRKHGRNRPTHMRKDTIITRHRKTYKLTVPNESMFQLNIEHQPITEPDSKLVAEAVCMMLHYLQNL
jgi:hypothetical protein